MSRIVKITLTYKFVKSRRHCCDKCELMAYCHDIDVDDCELGTECYYECDGEEIKQCDSDGCED